MTTHYELFWISPDKQGGIPMGIFCTETDAEAHIEQAQTILLSQALDDDEDHYGLMTKSAVLLGTWSINALSK